MYLGSTIRSAGTSCRPHDKPLAHRVSRVKAAAARSAGTRSVSLDAARTVGHSATATTQLLISSDPNQSRAHGWGGSFAMVGAKQGSSQRQFILGASLLAHTPLAKKVSHGDVAKLPYIFSYLAVAFETSPAQAITNCGKPT